MQWHEEARLHRQEMAAQKVLITCPKARKRASMKEDVAIDALMREALSVDRAQYDIDRVERSLALFTEMLK